MKPLFFVAGLTLALTQTPAHSQTAVPVSNDSTGLTSSASQQYDFYFSQKQAEQFVQLSNASYTQEDQIQKHRFRDKTYTQLVAKGTRLERAFDDYVLIGTGTLKEAKINGVW